MNKFTIENGEQNFEYKKSKREHLYDIVSKIIIGIYIVLITTFLIICVPMLIGSIATVVLFIIWNKVITVVFGVPNIDFWQMFFILIFASILFGGIKFTTSKR